MKIYLLFVLSIISLYAMPIPTGYQGRVLRTNKQTKIAPAEQYTIAYFLSSTCPCSQSHFQHLNDLQKKYPQYNFVGFHSNKNTSLAKAQKYFAQFDINFPIIQDKELKNADDFKALKTPHIFLLNKKGEVLYQGAASSSRNAAKADRFYLKEILEDLSKGKKPKVKYRKALGCYITR